MKLLDQPIDLIGIATIARAFESRGHCFNLFREPQRDMRGQYLRLGRHVYHLLSVRLKYNHTDEKTQVGEPWSREPGEGAGGRAPLFAVLQGVLEIGRASCRERVCQSV